MATTTKKNAAKKAPAKGAKKPGKKQKLFSVAEIKEVRAALEARPGNEKLIKKIIPLIKGAIGSLA